MNFNSKSDIRHYYTNEQYIVVADKVKSLSPFNIGDYFAEDTKATAIDKTSIFAFEKNTADSVDNELVNFIDFLLDPKHLVSVTIPSPQLAALAEMNPTSLVYVYYRNINLTYIISLLNDINDIYSLNADYLKKNPILLLNKNGLKALDGIIKNIKSNKLINGSTIFGGKL